MRCPITFGFCKVSTKFMLLRGAKRGWALGLDASSEVRLLAFEALSVVGLFCCKCWVPSKIGLFGCRY